MSGLLKTDLPPLTSEGLTFSSLQCFTSSCKLSYCFLGEPMACGQSVELSTFSHPPSGFSVALEPDILPRERILGVGDGGRVSGQIQYQWWGWRSNVRDTVSTVQFVHGRFPKDKE